MEKRQKLIFLDIDGTILIPGRGVRETVREGLKRARENGHKIFINTGRSYAMIPEELKELEFDGIICSAGSDIWIHGQNVFREAFAVPLIRKACRLLDEMNAIYILEEYRRVYMSERGQELLMEQEVMEDDNPEIARWKQFFRRQRDVISIREWDPLTVPIPKMTFMLWSKKDAMRLEEELGDDFYIAFYWKESAKQFELYNGELISKKENKGTAIRRTAEIMHLDFSDTVAFGDSMNDYHMIEAAACGVAMGNADDELKKIADKVCEPVEEDGVLRELERMSVI